MPSFREEVFLSCNGDSSVYKGFSKKQQQDFQKRWLQEQDGSLTQLSKKSKELLEYLEGEQSSVDKAKAEFAYYIHHSHPYLRSLLNSIPILNKPLTAGDYNDKRFLEAMKLLTQL